MNQQSDDRDKIELFLSARNLTNKDILSKSDPILKSIILQKVYYQQGKQGQEICLGQTEKIDNNLNPDWKKTFQMDFIFETQQFLRFVVQDIDSSDDTDTIGQVIVTIGQIMGSANQVLTVKLKKKDKDSGSLIIKADKVLESNYICWQWRGINLMNTDGWFGNSDPFLRFLKIKDNDKLIVHETQFIKDNLNPVWNNFYLSIHRLTDNDYNRSFEIQCWDNSKSGKHNYIGSCQTTLHSILNQNQTTFSLTNPKEKNPGKLEVINFSIGNKPSLIDYLRDGVQLNLITAVDFTGSNGDPRSHDSLHYYQEGQYNQYQTALYQVSEILLNYDTDRNVPLYGFGGKYKGKKEAGPSNCFALNGNIENPEVYDIDGIMRTYEKAVQNVDLYYPTDFAPVIKMARKQAEHITKKNKKVYFVLMMLTDGAITDFEETAKEIKKCSELPFSIIIIGVGNSNFGQMESLDGDDNPLKCSRDIVQFVAFRNYKENKDKLSEQVLKELPKQFLEYMAINNIFPKSLNNQVHLSQMQ